MVSDQGISRWRSVWTPLPWVIAIVSWVISMLLSVTSFATNDYGPILRSALAAAVVHFIGAIALVVTTQTRWRFALLLLSALLAPLIVDDLRRLSFNIAH